MYCLFPGISQHIDEDLALAQHAVELCFVWRYYFGELKVLQGILIEGLISELLKSFQLGVHSKLIE